MAATAAFLDPAQYADVLRQELMNNLFDGHDISDDVSGDDLDYNVGHGEDFGYDSLQCLEKELDEYHDHEIIRGILEQGRLKDYSRDVEDKLRQVELESIQDYIQESDNLVALHDQIKNCDGILGNMEQLLGKFQTDLGKVSDEIRQLQVQSQTMSTKLKNRRTAETRLGNFIEQLAVGEELVNGIVDAEVNEEYLEYLLALDKKLRFVKDDDVARSSQARRDVEPALERLRIKAVVKVREFLLQKIYTLKRPKTNIQIIQQSVLLKYKYFVRFLQLHGREVYDEVRNEYVAVLSKILSQHFRTYLASMEKMQLVVASSADLLGASDASSGVNVLSLFGKQTPRSGTTEQAFELGDRHSILAQLDKPAIIPHMAEFEGKKFPYEVIFRNVHKLLMDTATSEFIFCLDFFEDDNIFRDLSQSIIAVVEADLTSAVQELHDMITIMLMIRINHQHRRIMIKRRVPCLDDYLDRVHLLLWPRLKVLFDAQLSSIRAGNERGLFTNEPQVHMVTRRYSALTASMMTLMSDNEQDESGIFKSQGLTDMLDRMWMAIFDMLLRMSNLFKDRRQGIIFLIVNYNHILTVLRQADNQTTSSENQAEAAGGQLGRAGATAIKECKDQLDTCSSLYVEDQLSQHFRDFVEFVKKAEQAQKRLAVPDGAQIPGFDPIQGAPILRDFTQRWMGAIQKMHGEVARQFSGLNCGRDVLQASMTQLMLYYTRMLELLKKQGPEGNALVRDAPNIPSIMYEIKKITKT